MATDGTSGLPFICQGNKIWVWSKIPIYIMPLIFLMNSKPFYLIKTSEICKSSVKHPNDASIQQILTKHQEEATHFTGKSMGFGTKKIWV